MPSLQFYSNPRGGAKRWRYLVVFFITQLLLGAALLAALSVFGHSMPAPRLSANESLNEKARWLREHVVQGCDLLVVGSSMALNSVDGARIADLAGATSVLNAGAWGLSISDSAEMTKILISLCKPRVVVVAAYYGDFEGRWKTPIDWGLVESYIKGGNETLTYLRTMDPVYYGLTYLSRRKKLQKGNAIYESLRFDDSGAVLLDCNLFEVDAGRWNGHTKYHPLDAKSVDINLGGLAAIEAMTKVSDSSLLFVRFPLRPVAEEILTRSEIAELWDAVSRSVRNANGDFMSLQTLHNFEDKSFADFAHLNACGANSAAAHIGPEIHGLLVK